VFLDYGWGCCHVKYGLCSWIMDGYVVMLSMGCVLGLWMGMLSCCVWVVFLNYGWGCCHVEYGSCSWIMDGNVVMLSMGRVPGL